MPTVTRWYIRTSFICLSLALLAGILLALQSLLHLEALSGLFPVYIHLMVFGWLTQLVFGVVFWMFPKYSNEQPRGSEPLAWWAYGLLNAGLLLRLIAEPANAVQPSAVLGWMLVSAALLQLAAGVAFVANTWARVKGR
jgi:hypothetical protein